MIRKLIFGIGLCSALFLGACGGHAHSHEAGEHEHGTEQASSHGNGPEFNSDYVCPMHCEGSGSDQAGNCPACGMDYVAHAEHIKNGHSHDAHEGHNH